MPEATTKREATTTGTMGGSQSSRSMAQERATMRLTAQTFPVQCGRMMTLPTQY